MGQPRGSHPSRAPVRGPLLRAAGTRAGGRRGPHRPAELRGATASVPAPGPFPRPGAPAWRLAGRGDRIRPCRRWRVHAGARRPGRSRRGRHRRVAARASDARHGQPVVRPRSGAAAGVIRQRSVRRQSRFEQRSGCVGDRTPDRGDRRGLRRGRCRLRQRGQMETRPQAPGRASSRHRQRRSTGWPAPRRPRPSLPPGASPPSLPAPIPRSLCTGTEASPPARGVDPATRAPGPDGLRRSDRHRNEAGRPLPCGSRGACVGCGGGGAAPDPVPGQA
jgi:hypothetical protein